jgi:hypothetical protein
MGVFKVSVSVAAMGLLTVHRRAEQFLGATSGFYWVGSDPCDADNFPRSGGNPNPGAQPCSSY